MDSGQFAWLHHQQFQEESEQAFATEANVMHELKEAQIEQPFLSQDPPVGTQRRARQRPESLGGVDVDLAKTVAAVIAGVFPPAVVHHRPTLRAYADINHVKI